jgi:hypothetical protein
MSKSRDTTAGVEPENLPTPARPANANTNFLVTNPLRPPDWRWRRAGPTPSPLESLLIERIAACWIQIGHADAAAAQSRDVSIQQANFVRKRQDSAHRRYLTAVGALAMSRRLLGSAGRSPGPGSKARSPSTGPGKVVGDNCSSQGREEQGAVRAEGDPSEDDLVLEIGPTSDCTSGKNSPRLRRSKDSSKS